MNAVACNAKPLSFATVSNKNAPVGALVRGNFSDLVAMLCKQVVSPNKEGTGWVPGHIEPGPRTGDRVAHWDVLVLDVEGKAERLPDGTKRLIGPKPPTVSELAAELELHGLAGVVHSTHTHEEPTADGGTLGPRYRVVLNASRPILPAEIKPLGLGVVAMLGLGDCTDTQCLEPARLFFLPRCPQERAHLAQSEAVEGGVLDVDAVLTQAKRSAEPPPRKPGPAGVSVIEAFNAQADIGHILEQHGYAPKGRNRWVWQGSTSGLAGVVLLPDTGRAFSHHPGDPLHGDHAHDAFSVWCVLAHGGDFKAAVKDAAERLGMPAHRPNPGVDMSGLLTRFASPSAEWLDSEPVPAAARTVPAYILQLPGVMGECMDWMTRTAIRPQPVLSMVATLSLFATALARKVATPTMLRTNMYFVSVAGTGAGKEHGRKCLAKALDAAGLGDLVGGDGVASGAGLLSRVTAQPRTVFQIDEFGMMLQTLRSKNAGTHLATIIPNLMKLFGLTDGTYRGTEYADKGLKPRLEIPYPCVNLHATTTPNEFFPALASGDVTSGALNRMLVVFAPEGRVKTQKPTREAYPPAGVTEWLKAAQRMGCGLQGLAADSPLIVEYADGAEAIMEDFTDWIDALSDDGDSDATELWQRAWEHAAKLGLIHSLACLDSEELQARASGDSLRISCESTEWAISLTKHFMAQMQRDIAERVGDSEFDVLVKNVMRVVRGGGRKGCTHSELVKLSRGYKAKEPRVQEQVMLAITRAEDAKLVSVESPSGRGRPRLAYVAIEHLPPDFE